jgi:CheY-like chemotaxis protein
MKNILVVDDNVGLTQVMAASLRDYRVTVAHNAPEALARAAMLDSCDLIITDYIMPGIAGDEVAVRVRALHPAAKTLLVTGYGEFIKVAEETVDARLPKPFSPATLRQVVGGLIG